MQKPLVGAALPLLVAFASAQAQQAQRPPNCQGAPHRQFDFWIGTWDVVNPAGQPVGMNTITPELNGCVLHEHWESLGGAHRGNSYNIYDRTSDQWHQSWVDNGGLLLLLEGKLEGTSMVLRGTTRSAQGQETLNRITWTPFTRDSVQQLWETSSDGGQTWDVAFDGRYVRRR
ncbi:MAG TPA: hypothetical protein VGA37_06805 [Gemmatimonadales bacterium]